MSESKSTINNINKTTYINHKSNTDKYIEQLSTLEKKAFLIAQQHLETSFNLEESIGFIKWSQSQSQSKTS